MRGIALIGHWLHTDYTACMNMPIIDYLIMKELAKETRDNSNNSLMTALGALFGSK